MRGEETENTKKLVKIEGITRTFYCGSLFPNKRKKCKCIHFCLVINNCGICIKDIIMEVLDIKVLPFMRRKRRDTREEQLIGQVFFCVRKQ